MLPERRAANLRFCVRAEPRNLHPLMAIDDVSDTVRYLTGGVLIRVNRATQQAEPELATAWSVSRDYRSISFHIRQGVKFSDGTPFVAARRRVHLPSVARSQAAGAARRFLSHERPGDPRFEIQGETHQDHLPRARSPIS